MKPTTHCPINRFIVCSKGYSKELTQQDPATGGDICQWWCRGEEVCAVKLIALELIKLNEKKL